MGIEVGSKDGGIKGWQATGAAGRRSDSQQLRKGGQQGLLQACLVRDLTRRSCPDRGVACTPEEDRVWKLELGKQTKFKC